jgi:uncharacterized FAD-dependent dehydrogenase
MCPGGEVICSATEQRALAVNGMSYYARDAENSNSAIVVSVGPEDFAAGPLGGVEFRGYSSVRRTLKRLKPRADGGRLFKRQSLGGLRGRNAVIQAGNVF